MPRNPRLRKYYYKGRRMPVWAVNPNPGLKAIGGAATTALRMAKEVKSLLNVEYKFHDVTLTGAGGSPHGISASGEVHDLLQIPQNDTAEGRDGNSIRLKSINIKGTVSLAGGASFSRVKLMLVRDSQPNGTSAVFGHVYETADIDRLFRNRSAPGRFKVVATRLLKVSTNAGENVNHFQFYHKTNEKIQWSSGGTQDPYNATYYLLAISDQTSNEPAFDIQSRATYIDN